MIHLLDMSNLHFAYHFLLCILLMMRHLGVHAAKASFQITMLGYFSFLLIFLFVFLRESEPIRLLSLQFLGRLLVLLPSEKKGSRFFNLAVGRSRLLAENHRNICSRRQPIFTVIADRLFRFPLTDNLCATLFDVLLGGASPKQVIAAL